MAVQLKPGHGLSMRYSGGYEYLHSLCKTVNLTYKVGDARETWTAEGMEAWLYEM